MASERASLRALTAACLAALAACASSPAAPERAPAPAAGAPKVRVDGRVISDASPGDAGAFCAEVLGWEQKSGSASIPRMVALWPDRAAAALDAQQDAAPLLAGIRAAFEAGPGPTWRACSNAVRALEAEADPARRAAAAAIALGATQGCGDPLLLRRALEARPPGMSWPAGIWLSSECHARRVAADWHLARGETAEAWVVCRQGSAACAQDREGARLRLSEARAQHTLGRRGETLDLLAPLVEAADASVRRPALALAGVVAAETGDLRTARERLEQACNGDTSWTGAGRALSDLAFVLLQQGELDAGAKRLAEAQSALRMAGDDAGLARALNSEAAFWRATGDAQRADSLAQQARALVRAKGLLVEL